MLLTEKHMFDHCRLFSIVVRTEKWKRFECVIFVASSKTNISSFSVIPTCARSTKTSFFFSKKKDWWMTPIESQAATKSRFAVRSSWNVNPRLYASTDAPRWSARGRWNVQKSCQWHWIRGEAFVLGQHLSCEIYLPHTVNFAGESDELNALQRHFEVVGTRWPFGYLKNSKGIPRNLISSWWTVLCGISGERSGDILDLSCGNLSLQPLRRKRWTRLQKESSAVFRWFTQCYVANHDYPMVNCSAYISRAQCSCVRWEM